MTATLQPSLFDTTGPRLVALGEAARTQLDRRSWLDRLTPWLTGSQPLFEQLRDTLRWQQGVRPMYDRIVDVPRLIAAIDPAADPIVGRMQTSLGDHYGTAFDSTVASLYRDGRDSVAWHADRIGQTEKNPLVIIVSLGAPRDLLLRPMGGGPSRRITMHSGDLVVMGGATQHRWEHCIPKRAHAGPRMSITFRHNPEPRLRGETFTYGVANQHS
jgi:alkylated DNA repair dioxygenase AlkB